MLGRETLHPLPHDRENAGIFLIEYSGLERMAAAANDTGVSGVSLITPPQDAPASPDQSDYLDRSIIT